VAASAAASRSSEAFSVVVVVFARAQPCAPTAYTNGECRERVVHAEQGGEPKTEAYEYVDVLYKWVGAWLVFSTWHDKER
jgi:hypothetical protein